MRTLLQFWLRFEDLLSRMSQFFNLLSSGADEAIIATRNHHASPSSVYQTTVILLHSLSQIA